MSTAEWWALDTKRYHRLLAELQERSAQGVGALNHETKRIIWDNLPIWHRVRWLSDRLAERGVAMVASTYTNAWGELAPLFDPARPLESAARAYLHPILNRGTGHKLETMKRMVVEYAADGVILHSDRSCKPYSIGQVEQRARLGSEAGVLRPGAPADFVTIDLAAQELEHTHPPEDETQHSGLAESLVFGAGNGVIAETYVGGRIVSGEGEA